MIAEEKQTPAPNIDGHMLDTELCDEEEILELDLECEEYTERVIVKTDGEGRDGKGAPGRGGTR